MLTRRSLLLLIPILMIGVLLTGCTLWQQPKSNKRGIGNLGLEIWASRTQLKAGESVDLRFTVFNRGGDTEMIWLEDESAMDIRLYIGSSLPYKEINWSDGREITPEIRTLELAPGESKTIEMTWTAPEGAYGFPVDAHGILRERNRRSGEIDENAVFIGICVENCGKID